MNNDIKVPDVKVDIPNYPNWKRGSIWGLIWSLPVLIVFILLTPSASEPPFPPWYMEMLNRLILSIVVSGMMFVLITVFVAYKPIKKEKIKTNSGIRTIVGLFFITTIVGFFVEIFREKDFISAATKPAIYHILLASIILGTLLYYLNKQGKRTTRKIK